MKDERILLKMQNENFERLDSLFNFDVFWERLCEIIEKDRVDHEKIPFDWSLLPYEIISNNFFLRPANLKQYILENWSRRLES